MFALLIPVFHDCVVVTGPGRQPVTAEVIEHVSSAGHVDAAMPPPSVLKEISRSPTAMDAVKGKTIMYGGAPLRKATGNLLTKHGVKLVDLIGTSTWSLRVLIMKNLFNIEKC